MKYCEKCGADIKPKIHHFCTLNQNPFNCDKCDFTNGRNLIEYLDHYKAKHGGKDIPCNVCQFRGKFPVNFRNHLRSAHSQTFQCEHCDCVFGIQKDLKMHLKSKTKVLRTCEECNFKSCSKNGLVLHIKEVHEMKNLEVKIETNSKETIEPKINTKKLI